MYESVGDEEREIVAEVEAYVAADFVPPIEVRVMAVAVASGIPRELRSGEEWVYLRREAGRVGEP